MICLIRDVSDAELADRGRREERELLDVLIDSLEDYAVILTDPDGYVTTWNRGAERLYGRPRHEALGAHLRHFHAAEERGRVAEMLELARADGRVTDSGWRDRGDGPKFWAEDLLVAMFDTHDDLRGFALITRDSTDRRRREEALVKAQEQLDTLTDLFVRLDSDGRLAHFNERLVELTGTSRSDLTGRHFTDLVVEDDRDDVRDRIERLIATDEIHQIRTRLEARDEEIVPYEIRGRRLRGPQGETLGAVALGRDITTRVESERERDRHVARLNEFASVLAHDLRNSLALAEGYLPQIATHVPREDERALATVREALERIEDIIDDVLEITKTGRPATEPVPTSLGSTASTVWARVTTDATGTTMRSEDAPTIRADPSLLERLLMNLFRNAIEHAGSGVTVRVGRLDDGFFVEDDGPGIPPDERTTVFDWRYTTKEDGSGIGLKSVEQIVQAHDWTIAITEGSEGGARFEITNVDVLEDA